MYIRIAGRPVAGGPSVGGGGPLDWAPPPSPHRGARYRSLSVLVQRSPRHDRTFAPSRSCTNTACHLRFQLGFLNERTKETCARVKGVLCALFCVIPGIPIHSSHSRGMCSALKGQTVRGNLLELGKDCDTLV